MRRTTTYVYDSVSYWDKEKQQPRSKRKLIGKIDPVTGEIVPTGGRRGRKPKNDAPEPSGLTENVTEDAHSPQIPVLEQEDPADYKQLYEASRRSLLEKDAAIARMEATISRLTREKEELVSKLEQLVRENK